MVNDFYLRDYSFRIKVHLIQFSLLRYILRAFT